MAYKKKKTCLGVTVTTSSPANSPTGSRIRATTEASTSTRPTKPKATAASTTSPRDDTTAASSTSKSRAATTTRASNAQKRNSSDSSKRTRNETRCASCTRRKESGSTIETTSHNKMPKSPSIENLRERRGRISKRLQREIAASKALRTEWEVDTIGLFRCRSCRKQLPDNLRHEKGRCKLCDGEA